MHKCLKVVFREISTHPFCTVIFLDYTRKSHSMACPKVERQGGCPYTYGPNRIPHSLLACSMQYGVMTNRVLMRSPV